MPLYRKKPIAVEAHELTWEDIDDVMAWCGSKEHSTRPPFRGVTGIIILNGGNRLVANFGDWILKDVAGDFYPCPKDVFEKTYEAIDGEA